MATNNTFFSPLTDDFPATRDTSATPHGRSLFSCRAVDIGKERSRVVSSRKDSVSFITFEPLPGGGYERDENRSATLSLPVVKNFYDKITEIYEKVQQLKNGELEEKVSYYIGDGYYISLTPDYKCVLLRKHYRPPFDTTQILPGLPGFVFKLDEFENFYIEFAEISNLMQLDSVELPCNPDIRCADILCKNCKI